MVSDINYALRKSIRRYKNSADGKWAKLIEIKPDGNKTVWEWDLAEGQIIKYIDNYKEGIHEYVYGPKNSYQLCYKTPRKGLELPGGGKYYEHCYSNKRLIRCEYDAQGNWSSLSEVYSDGSRDTWKFDELGRIIVEHS